MASPPKFEEHERVARIHDEREGVVREIEEGFVRDNGYRVKSTTVARNG